MANDSPSQRYAGATGRFWRNVLLIALAHVALIAGLIRWSLAARASSEPETIIWLGEAGDVAAAQLENEPSPAATLTTPPPIEQTPAKVDEAEEEKPVATTAKSEIELPSPTPKATPRATPTPKPAATLKPKPKRTPRSTPRPTPKKTLVAKASPKPSPKPPKERRSPDRRENVARAKSTLPSHGSEKTGSTGKSGSAGGLPAVASAKAGGSSASEFAWYGNMLHDRFYRAWIQPTANITADTKISTLVRVRIEKDGRVSKFEIVKPSGNVAVNESVRVVAKQVTQVDAPPTGLIKGDHYEVNINFELNTEDKTTN
ncbi:MAG TPA: TonB family protein [Candidatus Udaeobacter sp.]|jgi:TonB family protein